MIKHMNEELLKKHLIITIDEILTNKNIEIGKEIKFIITPNRELDKKHDSVDDYMRLGIFQENNLKGRLIDLDIVAGMLSAPNSKFPIWANVSLKEITQNEIIFLLEISLRFRLPKILSNQETGHPPFKAIY